MIFNKKCFFTVFTVCNITRVLLTGGSETDEASYAYGRSAPLKFKATVQSTCQITQPLQYMWKIIPYNTPSVTALPLVQETLQVDYYIFNPIAAAFGKYITELTVSS